MFKVTTANRPEYGQHRQLVLEGRLAGEWVDEFARAFGHLEAEAGGPLTLDLSGLTFVDGRGADTLRELSERGVRLVGSSSFVATLVAGSGRHDGHA